MNQANAHAADSKRILIGFFIASFLLLVAGTIAWFSLSERFETVEQYSTDAQIAANLGSLKVSEQNYIRLPNPDMAQDTIGLFKEVEMLIARGLNKA